MRITIELDDELPRTAGSLTGTQERTALIHAGLRVSIERGSARRLARLGASELDLPPIPRRRSNLP